MFLINFIYSTLKAYILLGEEDYLYRFNKVFPIYSNKQPLSNWLSIMKR